VAESPQAETETYLFEFRDFKKEDSKFADIMHDGTPEKIAHYIWQRFEVESDQAQFGTVDYWQTPEELLANQGGDCEDFALFAHEILKINGINSFIVNIYSNQFAHTVTIYKENGHYRMLDGKRIKKAKARSLLELLNKVYPHWREGAIVRFLPEQHRARILKQFQRL